MMKKILYTTPVLAHPPIGGPALRVENSIKALSRVSDLYVMSRLNCKKGELNSLATFYSELCVKFMNLPRSNWFSTMGVIKRAIPMDMDTYAETTVSDEYESSYIARYAERNDIDIIWLGFGNISYGIIKRLRALKPRLKLVNDTDSVWSKFILRELPHENSAERRQIIQVRGTAKIKEELDLVRMCDVTTAVSKVDADYYRQLTTDKNKIRIFSNVIDLANYGTVPPLNGFLHPGVYLSGSFFDKNCPMEKASRWFIKDVLPLLEAQNNGIHIYITGKNSDIVLKDIRKHNITITGQVDNILPYLSSADVCIVPLQFESGTRFKILEAAACRVPIVSTTLGAEGIPVEHGKHILLADDPTDFSNAIIKLINNRAYATQITEECYKLITNNYSIMRGADEAREIIKYLDTASFYQN